LNACATHRGFLAAIADGETALVPADTVEHVNHCADCMREVRAHQLLASKLRQASEHLEEAEPTRRPIPLARPRFRVVAASIAAAIVLGATGVGWVALSRPDPVLAAVNASSQPVGCCRAAKVDLGSSTPRRALP